MWPSLVAEGLSLCFSAAIHFYFVLFRLFCCVVFNLFYSIFLLSPSDVICWSEDGNSTAPLTLG